MAIILAVLLDRQHFGNLQEQGPGLELTTAVAGEVSSDEDVKALLDRVRAFGAANGVPLRVHRPAGPEGANHVDLGMAEGGGDAGREIVEHGGIETGNSSSNKQEVAA